MATITHRILVLWCMLFTYTALYAETDSLPCGCDTLWQKEPAKEFVSTLVQATQKTVPVWPGYRLGDGAIVLNAGKTSEGNHCLGLWKNGKHVSYACLPDVPRMLTPLYSYYLDFKNLVINRDTIPFFTTTREAPEFKKWLSHNDIVSAVYMLTDYPDFPVKIPAIVKVQLGLHESFHVEVMLRYWYTKKGNWPAWDRQPDRKALQACYTANDSVKSAIAQEQQLLTQLIGALLDKDTLSACNYGNAFLQKREQRYRLVSDISIKQDEQTNLDCITAEIIMEMEEGIADYASWTKLYESGQVNRELLLRRYGAKQADIFYLTGAMLLHAIALTDPRNINDVINRIITSRTPQEASLSKILMEKLKVYCGK